MIGNLLKKFFGTQNDRLLKKLYPIVENVNAFEEKISLLSSDELKAKTEEFRSRLRHGETLDDILPEAFAVVRETAKRVLGMRHYDVQVLGGVVLHKGMISEMATGEGKTLVATLPVYLNAITGRGVHVITVNDYLARRDRNWMGPVYEFLGLTVGVIQHDISPADRQYSYSCDITYGTNNEFGFDYLRDNMVVDISQRVQRELNYAIVDEVDSILVDEARTPLIISGPTEDSTDKYYRIERFVRGLKSKKITEQEMIDAKNKGVDYEKGYDYLVDEKHRNIWFTEEGEKKFEQYFNFTPDDPRYIDLKHNRDQAAKARDLFKTDVDYVVKDDQVIIVDSFTGRLMPGRRFSDGLHQALEAKENVKIERENQTLATVTFQNYFRMYEKLSGMTGTAETEAVEFENIYKLSVVVIPTNKPLSRVNNPDVIYKTEREKFNAVVDDVITEHKKGRPVLVGTVSIDCSERLSAMLRKRNIQHNVLNAKYHEQEAEIIARAGQEGAITIATNMAGRGTDIVLGEGVQEKGGLHVIGTERHESRRIDNQLRGRSGRQGDPGSSLFYLSLEDDLMRIFGGDRLHMIMDRLGMEEGQEIQHPLVSRAIETAQKRVETRNYEIRKHLLEYDNVMNRQREIVYTERRKVLEGDGLREHVIEIIEDVAEGIIYTYCNPEMHAADRDDEAFFGFLRNKFGMDFDDLKDKPMSVESLQSEIIGRLIKFYEEKCNKIGEELFFFMQKSILLQIIDAKWKEHLHNLDSLREGIGLRAYAQKNPLVEYQHEAFDMFSDMIELVKEEALEFIFKMEMQPRGPIVSVMQDKNQTFVHPESEGIDNAVATKSSPVSQLFSSDAGQRHEKPETIKRSSEKVGRNDPCTCGSGKKFKKCCGQ